MAEAAPDDPGTSAMTYFDRIERPASVPIWLEPLVALEWVSLRVTPVFYGYGVPRGDGSAVVLVPGFLGTDWYLLDLHGWLGRVGYRAHLSRIGRNAECFDILLERLLRTVEVAHRESGRRVHLVGHSLGGILSRAAAVRRPERIASVVALGSPFRGFNSHPLVMRMASAVRRRIRAERAGSAPVDCFTGCCGCEAVGAIQTAPPPSVARMAIYTKTDGVTDWRSCIDGDPETDVEVAGTHVGLVWNPAVYSLLAEHLTASAERRGAVLGVAAATA